MTRSFAFMMAGQPVAALQMNYLGPFVFAVFASQVPYRLWVLFQVARRAYSAGDARARRTGLP